MFDLGQLIRGFGLLSLLVCAIATVAALAFDLVPLGKDPAGYLSNLALMALVSGALVVAGRLRSRADPLADKVLPASLVAYLLFLLMAIRWLG